jgi:hypothetical protein
MIWTTVGIVYLDWNLGSRRVWPINRDCLFLQKINVDCKRMQNWLICLNSLSLKHLPTFFARRLKQFSYQLSSGNNELDKILVVVVSPLVKGAPDHTSGICRILCLLYPQICISFRSYEVDKCYLWYFIYIYILYLNWFLTFVTRNI